MLTPRARLFKLALLALLVPGPSVWSAPAQSGDTAELSRSAELLRSAELDFGIYALGAKGIDMRFTTRREAGLLQVDTAMRTAGMLDWLISFTMTGRAAAQIADGGRIRPLHYSTDSDGSWSKRIIRMHWGENGLPVTVVEPPNEDDDREPVPDALKLGTTDPTTALLARALLSHGTPPCSGMDAIFDGRRRYNLHYQPLGPEVVKPHNRSAYSGPAFKCMVRAEPVAGYTRKYLAEWSEKDEQPTYIWLVQPPGFAAWLPVQLEGGFRLGAASGWISSARLNGRPWLEPLGPIRAELPRETLP